MDRPFSSALVLFAHPDDAEFMCGGTVATWAREGCDVHYVVVTDGSAGSNEPGVTREGLRPIRESEQRAAADVLGVRSVTFLGEVDGMLEVTLDTRRKVCREVRRLRPEVIVAPDPSRLWSGSEYINHVDHRRAGELALCAVMPDAPTRPMFPELLDEGFEPFEVPNLYLSTGEPDTVVDISDAIDLKIKALGCHASQLSIEDVEPWVRKRAQHVASENGGGFEFGEGFKAFHLLDDEEE
jgi:LmbE family N-acetylglucosaminyl deacetylase